MLLRFNPDLLAGPNSRSLAGRIVVSDAAVGDEWITLRLRGQIEVGKRTIGGVVYREFDHESLSEDQRKYKSTFLYDPALNPEMSGLPSHSVDCDEGVKANGLANFCSVEVYYMDIRAIIELIGDGPELPPIQREKFPELAREIADALRVLDVTEKVDELPPTLRRFP